VRAYRKETERQRLLVKKAGITQQRLLFVIKALRRLFADEHFVTLLRAERLRPSPARSPTGSAPRRTPDMPPVRIAFDERRLERCHWPRGPSAPCRQTWKQSVKYKRIARSVMEIGG
jgi:hypothetical protein